jgi:hypothetical protein
VDPQRAERAAAVRAVLCQPGSAASSTSTPPKRVLHPMQDLRIAALAA